MDNEQYIAEKTLNHFKMIREYKELMAIPHAQQKRVFHALLKKYPYKNFDSIKQTFAKLRRKYPEKFE